MQVNIFFNSEGTDADLIDVPQDLISVLKTIQDDFFKWLFNKNNNHKYWVIENGQKKGCSYDTDAFVNWINNTILKKSQYKATIVSVNEKNIDYNLPKLFF